MIDPVTELKVRAELLHHGVAASDGRALSRLRVLAELRGAKEAELVAIAPEIRRKHCLATVAREAGFTSWEHASAVLTGREGDDFGSLLYPHGASAHWNIWSAR